MTARIPRKKGQPANSKKHSDLYTDENPKGTIKGLGFKDRAKAAGKAQPAAVYRKFIEEQKRKTKNKR